MPREDDLLNVGTRKQLAFKGAENNEFKSNVFLADFTLQEA